MHLRLDPDLRVALKAWADDDGRTLTGHINFLLRQAIKQRPAGESEREIKHS